MKKIRVVVVDDSALVRSLLTEIINRQKDMECVGAANDPLVARKMIHELNPNIITLNIKIPHINNINPCHETRRTAVCGAFREFQRIA